MAKENTCPACGALIPPEAPGGQCISCLVGLGLPGMTAKVRYFGDYELESVLGEGGMGVVYRARQRSLNRLVALKMIRSGRFATSEEVRRFQAEAEAVANLDHPHIVPVFEHGEHEGWHFFSMKLIEGRDLDRAVKDGDFAFATPTGRVTKSEARKIQVRIAEVLKKVARAMHFAHQRQIIHRDLKPTNILIDRQGEPCVVDFGLAKLLEAEAGDTRTQQILGTAAYMAPEQARGERLLTTSVDVFALGAILYYLLSGRPPFEAGSPLETLRLVTETDPKRPAGLNPLADADLETICLKCLQKDPDLRYDSAAALAEELELWLAGRPIRARPSGRWERTIKWIRRNPVKTALVSALIFSVIAPLTVALTYILTFQHILSQHDVRQMHPGGWFTIEIIQESEDRCTPNFAKLEFQVPGGREARLTFQNVPPDWISRLQVIVMADIPALPDARCSGVLTNGSIVWLNGGTQWDRNYYFAAKNWSVADLLAHATNPAIRLTMISAGAPASGPAR